MKDELYFENIGEIGNLYLEHVFFEFEKEPILMICVDDRKQLYLCLCAEIRGGQRWIVSCSDIGILEELVEGRIDIASALCIPEQLVLVTRDLRGIESSVIINTNEVDPFDLPKKGTLLKCNQTAAKNYLMSKRLVELSSQLTTLIEKTCYRESGMSYSVAHDSTFQTLNDFSAVYFDLTPEETSKLDNQTLNQTYCININDTYVNSSDKKQTDNVGNDYLQAA